VFSVDSSMNARGRNAAYRQPYTRGEDDSPMTPPDVDTLSTDRKNDREASGFSLQSVAVPLTPPEIDTNDAAVDTQMDDDEIMVSKKKDPVSDGHAPSSSSTIVLDLGSHSCRIGSASSSEPEHVMFSSWRDSLDGSNYYERRAIQYSFYERGNAWDLAMAFNTSELDLVLKACFQKCDVRGKKVLLSESHVRNDGLRRYLIEALFDKYGVSEICIQKTPVLHCVALKRLSGVVVDVGASLASIVPVINGVVLEKAARHSSVAGNALDIALAQCLTPEASSKFHSRLDLQAMKELYCFCPGSLRNQQHDFTRLFGQHNHTDPLASVPMLLLSPLLSCIKDCIHCMRSLELPLINKQRPSSNIPDDLPILLVGGSSRFVNFKDALVTACSEDIGPSGIRIGQLPPPSANAYLSSSIAESVLTPPADACAYTAWTGGRYLASGDFQLPWLSSSEYKKRGIDAAICFFG